MFSFCPCTSSHGPIKVSRGLVGDADSQQSSETHLPHPSQSRHGIEGDGGYLVCDSSISRSPYERGGTSRGGAESPFSLSPFRFVGHEVRQAKNITDFFFQGIMKMKMLKPSLSLPPSLPPNKQRKRRTLSIVYIPGSIVK